MIPLHCPYRIGLVVYLVAHAENQHASATLQEYRSTIDTLDAAMVYILAERFRVTHNVGLLKMDADLPPADRERERAQLERLYGIADQAGLDRPVVDVVFPAIMAEVRRRHHHVRETG